MKIITTLLFAALIFISCQETKKEAPFKKQEVKTEQIAVDYKSIEVEIEGMTCEIGCARTIQSKLSKLDGVTDPPLSAANLHTEVLLKFAPPTKKKLDGVGPVDM